MDEKNYKSNIESASMAEDFSLEDILDEYRVSVPDFPMEGDDLADRSKRIVLEALDAHGGHSSISSIDEIVEETVSTLPAAEPEPEPEPEPAEEPIPEPSLEEIMEDSHGNTEAEAGNGLSEYELRELVDSDEREAYASAEIDYELDGEEYEGDEPPTVRRDAKRRRAGKRGGGKSAVLSPVVALLALITHKRSQRVKADAEAPTPETEDANIPEMEPERAAKLYGGHMLPMKLRGKIALGVSAVMLYITFGFYSFLPLAGAMKGPVGASLSLLILLLTVMLCGLDVFVAGIMNIVRGRPAYESLVSLSCLLAIIDAAVIFAMKTGDFGLPFCAVAAISMSLAIWGNYFSCKGLRFGFKVAAADSAAAVTAEKGISGKGSAMFKGGRGIAGFVRRSEEADIGEYVYSIAAPLLVIFALIFSALAAFARGQASGFFHIFSAMIACSAAFSGAVCFAHPFAVTAGKLFSAGAAVCGWSGVRDIGKSRGVVITDGDIFPKGTVDISGIRVLQDLSADKVISYTGSVIAASANGLSGAFTDLIRRNGYSLCRVENFTPHDGGGLTAVVNGENVMVGNAGFMNLMGIRVPQKMANRNTVFTAISGELSGLFDIDYKPLPAVQDALGVLMRSGCDAVFALRDFNMTPDALRNKFHVSGESFNLPSYPERFAISGARSGEESSVAAVIAREGMVPVVEVSERGKRLYYVSMALAAFAAVCSGLGLLLMFIACWQGDFEGANAAKAVLLMLLSLIPNVLAGLWLQR